MNFLITRYTFLCFLMPLMVSGQINKPSLSPRIITEQQVGLVKVKLDYGQPNIQGRQIFGGLIPYHKLWRTGANSCTKIQIDQAIEFGGQKIPKGSYSLYSIPAEKEWIVILNKNTKNWGAAGYNQKDDLLRLNIPVVELKDKRETFSIHFEGFNANGGDFVITWENTKIVVPVFIDSDEVIFKEIDQKITQATEAVSAQTYFDAAQFYYHKNKDLDKAVEWFDKAIKMRPNAFWYVYYRAELAYHLRDYKGAKAYVQDCFKKAKASTSSDFGYLAKCKLLLDKLETK